MPAGVRTGPRGLDFRERLDQLLLLPAGGPVPGGVPRARVLGVHGHVRRLVPRRGPRDRFLPGLLLRRRVGLGAERAAARRGRRDPAPPGESGHPAGGGGRARSDGPVLPGPCPRLRRVLPATRGLRSRHFSVLPGRGRLRARPRAGGLLLQARADPGGGPVGPLRRGGPGGVRGHLGAHHVRGLPRPAGALLAGRALLFRRAPAAPPGRGAAGARREDGAGAARRVRAGRGAAGGEGAAPARRRGAGKGEGERMGSELPLSGLLPVGLRQAGAGAGGWECSAPPHSLNLLLTSLYFNLYLALRLINEFILIY